MLAGPWPISNGQSSIRLNRQRLCRSSIRGASVRKFGAGSEGRKAAQMQARTRNCSKPSFAIARNPDRARPPCNRNLAPPEAENQMELQEAQENASID